MVLAGTSVEVGLAATDLVIIMVDEKLIGRLLTWSSSW